MPSDSDNGNVVKKRQPSKASSFSGGYDSLDESTAPHAKDKKRKGGRRPDEKPDGGKASVIWLVLVIGLMFCLMDAAYIARVLERGTPTIEADTEILAATLTKMRRKASALEQKVEQRVVRPFKERQQEGGGMFGSMFGKKMTPEDRRKARQAEQKIAEEKRIKNIKMAALEAMKAQHGGKLPDNMIDKALEDDEAFKAKPIGDYRQRSMTDGKKRVLDLFIEAGLKEMDDSTYAVLPTWDDVSKMYGKEPRIVGLEQCETFRSKGNPWDHFVSTAGTFNSGTNLMAEMLIHNCHMQARMDKLGHQNRGIRWQVPWGKHTPPGDEEYRVEHKSTKDKDVDANMILPAVTVRDPYYWMQSMCKHHYTASWRSSDRCPNLIPLEKDKASYPMLRDKDWYPLSVRYADFHRYHQSLTGLWNDWYNEYKGVEFQRLFVRYEDLLFHPKNVTETVCHCAGGVMNKGKFSYVVDSAKKGLGAHGSVRTGYVDAIIKYGSDRNRYNGYLPEDLEFARKSLDTNMMKDFGYKYHPMSLETQNDNEGNGEENGGNEKEDSSDEAGNSKKEHKEENEEPDVPDDKESGEGGEDKEAEKSADIGDKMDGESENAADESG